MTAPAAAATNADGDRFYPIPDPATGDVVALPNCSSVLDVLASFSLPTWRMKMAALGIAHRLDLQARVVAAHNLAAGKERNAELRACVDAAIDHGQTLEPGKGFLAADFGSAIHLICEQIDDGLDILSLPASVQEHAAAYLATIEGHGLEVVESEATVYHHNVDVMGETYGYAATLDRIVRFSRADATADIFDGYELGRGCFCLDIKTGKIHDKVAMQLASHANAEGIYDAATGEHRMLPEDLRRDLGFALQLTADGARLVPVDLIGSQAWAAFAGALAVKSFSAAKPLGQPLAAPVSPPLSAPSASVTGGDVPVASSPTSPSTAAPAPVADATAASPDPAAVEVPSPIKATPQEVVPNALTSEVPNASQGGEGERSERSTVTPAAPDPTPSPGPTHIADPLDVLRLQIEERHAAALFKKHAWLVGRIAALDERGRAHVAAQWPAGVATLQHGNPHTLDELEAIDKAITAAEAAVGAPFPETNDPTDPRSIRVPNDDPRIAEYVARLAALPHDLLADVSANVPGDVPKLTNPNAIIYQAHLDAIDAALRPAEEEAAPRLAKLDEVLTIAAEQGIGFSDPLGIFNKGNPLALSADEVTILDYLMDATVLGLVAWEFSYDDDIFFPVVRDATPITTPYPKPREQLAAGKAMADALGRPRPRSAADVLADPILVAAYAMADAHPLAEPAA